MATWSRYHTTFKNQYTASALDLDTAFDTAAATPLKVALVTSAYIVNADTHDFFDDITNEIVAANYTAGGNHCANAAITLASGVITFDADDPATWAQNASGFTGSIRAILYGDSGVAATSPLLKYSSLFTVDTTVNALPIELSPTGIFTDI